MLEATAVIYGKFAEKAIYQQAISAVSFPPFRFVPIRARAGSFGLGQICDAEED